MSALCPFGDIATRRWICAPVGFAAPWGATMRGFDNATLAW